MTGQENRVYHNPTKLGFCFKSHNPIKMGSDKLSCKERPTEDSCQGPVFRLSLVQVPREELLQKPGDVVNRHNCFTVQLPFIKPPTAINLANFSFYYPVVTFGISIGLRYIHSTATITISVLYRFRHTLCRYQMLLLSLGLEVDLVCVTFHLRHSCKNKFLLCLKYSYLLSFHHS